MEFYKNLIGKYAGLGTIFKSFFVLIILFLLFFAVNLFITVKSKRESAYTVLNSEMYKTMLQDTRVHNWDEIDNKKKNN